MKPRRKSLAGRLCVCGSTVWDGRAVNSKNQLHTLCQHNVFFVLEESIKERGSRPSGSANANIGANARAAARPAIPVVVTASPGSCADARSAHGANARANGSILDGFFLALAAPGDRALVALINLSKRTRWGVGGGIRL